MAVKQLSARDPDGSCLGYNSSDLVSFYGATPIAQRSGANQAQVTSTTIVPVSTTAITPVTTSAVVVSTTQSTSTAPYGFASQAQADEILTAINALVTDTRAGMAAVNSLITQSASNFAGVNSLITRTELIRVLANELRLSLVPTTGVGLVAGA